MPRLPVTWHGPPLRVGTSYAAFRLSVEQLIRKTGALAPEEFRNLMPPGSGPILCDTLSDLGCVPAGNPL